MRKIEQLSFWVNEVDEQKDRLDKMRKGLRGLYKRMGDLKKDAEFLEEELEDFIKENLGEDSCKPESNPQE